jgi:hypothetical protein
LRQIVLDLCDRTVVISCGEDETAALIGDAFGGLVARTNTGRATPHLHLLVRSSPPGHFRIVQPDGTLDHFENPADFLFHVDKHLTIGLQRLRPDLFFVHAGALALHERALVLSAPAGTGKSTLTLIALNHGLDYLSDELAPIDVKLLTVHPYRRSLYLKSRPPPPHSLPQRAIKCDTRYYVPPVPSEPPDGRRARLAGLVFLRRDGMRFEGLQPITAASGAARLIANTLNLLAHPGDGLDTAATLTEAVPCFELDVTDLEAAAITLKEFLES